MLPVSIINRAAAIAFRTSFILAATDYFFTFPFAPYWVKLATDKHGQPR